MKFKITPGDWSIQLSDQSGYRDVIDQNGTILAICCGSVDGIDEIANSVAIAAIPKMLDLLVRCSNAINADYVPHVLGSRINTLLKELGGEE